MDRETASRLRISQRPAGYRLQRGHVGDSSRRRRRHGVHNSAVIRPVGRAAARTIPFLLAERYERCGACAQARIQLVVGAILNQPTNGKRITVVTAGHISACPRMLKAADALTDAGYRVRLVSVSQTPWMTVTDAAISARRHWTPFVVDYSQATAPALRRKTGVRFKLMQTLATTIGSSSVPMGVAIRAYGRAHDELVDAATAEPADLVYGGSTGALAAVVESARKLGVPYAVDFEDFHSGEAIGEGSELQNALAERVERYVIPGAAFITAASPMIAETYADQHGISPLVIHNTFSIASAQVAERRDGRLHLYWFSQTLGPRRGLEEVIRAAGVARIEIELHLRARPIPEYLDSLQRLQAAVASQLKIVNHQPATPDDMVALAQPYDAGLACEEPEPLNRQLC